MERFGTVCKKYGFSERTTFAPPGGASISNLDSENPNPSGHIRCRNKSSLQKYQNLRRASQHYTRNDAYILVSKPNSPFPTKQIEAIGMAQQPTYVSPPSYSYIHLAQPLLPRPHPAYFGSRIVVIVMSKPFPAETESQPRFESPLASATSVQSPSGFVFQAVY